MDKADTTADITEVTNEAAINLPEFLSNSWDAPTITVDGLAGMATSTHQTKIVFAEHFPTPGRLVGKCVLNVVMPNDQFLKIADALTDLAKRIRQAEEQGN